MEEVALRSGNDGGGENSTVASGSGEEENDVHAKQPKTQEEEEDRTLFNRYVHQAKQALEAELNLLTDTVPVREDIARHDLEVISAMNEKANEFLNMDILRQCLLSFVAGMFLTMGALLSVVLASSPSEIGVGYKKLMTAFGFTIGFASISLCRAIMFTEINVLIPLWALKQRRRMGVGLLAQSLLQWKRLTTLWTVSFLGNFAGALTMASMCAGSYALHPSYIFESLREQLAVRLYGTLFGLEGWFGVVLSGVLANVLVGLAVFFSTSGRMLHARLLGLSMPVLAFVTLGLQHSSANMGFFSLGLLMKEPNVFLGLEMSLLGKLRTFDSSFGLAIALNLIPSALGNVVGGFFIAVLLSVFYSYKAQSARQLLPT